MTEETTDTKPKKINVFCLDAEIGESYIQTVCKLPAPVDKAGTEVGDAKFLLEVVAGELEKVPNAKEQINSSDGGLVLVQFMDIISVESIKKNLEEIREMNKMPLVTALFREDGQTDFKVSCPECGQKLWIRDQDAGKRGRCPNCKIQFVLPSQTEGLKNKLNLPPEEDIVFYVRKDLKLGQELLQKMAGLITPEEAAAPPTTTANISSKPKKVIYIKR